MNGTLLRYSNEGVAGGSGSNGSLATPEEGSVTIKFDSGVKSSQLTELSANVIKSLCASAGINEVIVTSLYRPPESQAQTMFNNLQKNNRISYAPAGKKIVAIYDSYKEKYGLSSTTPFTDVSQIEKVRGEMLNAIKSAPPEAISKHSADPSNLQAIDISPTRMVPNNKSPSLREILLSAKEQGILKAFLGPAPKGPGDDPAYHIEIWQNEKAPKGYESAKFTNASPPTVAFTMQNSNLKKSTTWLYPLLKDHNDMSNEMQSKKS